MGCSISGDVKCETVAKLVDLSSSRGTESRNCATLLVEIWQREKQKQINY